MIRRISGIVLIILGIVMFIFASYITEQVSQGKTKISSAQKQVNTTRSITSISPYTKDVGGMVADSAQKKINQGKQEVHKYSKTAIFLYIGSGVLVVVGIGLFAISFFHRKKKRR